MNAKIILNRVANDHIIPPDANNHIWNRSELLDAFLVLSQSYLKVMSEEMFERLATIDGSIHPGQILNMSTPGRIVIAGNHRTIFKCIYICGDYGKGLCGVWQFGMALSEIRASRLLYGLLDDTKARYLGLTSEFVIIQFPYVGVSLSKLELLPDTRYSSSALYIIWMKLIDAVHHLHIFGKCAHLNLNPSHVLLQSRRQIQVNLISFRNIQRYYSGIGSENKLRFPRHESNYSAPELVLFGTMRASIEDLFRCDIWSLGCIFLFITYHSTRGLNTNMWTRCRYFIELHISYPKRTCCMNLVHRMLNSDPIQRPCISKVKEIFQL